MTGVRGTAWLPDRNGAGQRSLAILRTSFPGGTSGDGVRIQPDVPSILFGDQPENRVPFYRKVSSRQEG